MAAASIVIVQARLMLGRGNGGDYPRGADLYPFCAGGNISGGCTGFFASKSNRRTAAPTFDRISSGWTRSNVG
ncbi:hypothetical protein QLG10_21820, partial [Pseudomonas sp. V98_8]|uniref:hypothetical protein n=1 Tax=Pseudomonas sp. V98_8 TaxID=3044228 RepID=UPI00249F7C1A